MSKKRRWTKEELNYLEENYTSKTREELVEHLDRSWSSISGKLFRLGLRVGAVKGCERRIWLQEEETFLKENYIEMSNEELSIYLNRTTNAVKSRKSFLGLNDREEQLRSNIKEKDRYTFRVGPYGHIVRYDRILKKRETYHRVVYEEHYGIELKSNQIIHHIDGDKNNNDIKNLLLCKGHSRHKDVHYQLEEQAYILIREGIIKFDKETGLYYANPNRKLREKERNINAIRFI